MKSAIAQYFMIPMGMGLYYSYVFRYAWKPLFTRSNFKGEIGSSDMDDPFTQEEKIGYVSKGKEDRTQKEREETPDNERERDYYDRDYTRESSEREYQDLLDNKIDRLSGFDQYY